MKPFLTRRWRRISCWVFLIFRQQVDLSLFLLDLEVERKTLELLSVSMLYSVSLTPIKGSDMKTLVKSPSRIDSRRPSWISLRLWLEFVS